MGTESRFLYDTRGTCRPTADNWQEEYCHTSEFGNRSSDSGKEGKRLIHCEEDGRYRH